MTAVDHILEDNKRRTEQKPTAKHQKQADLFLNEMKQFEEDRVALAITSRNTAWKVASVAAFITLLLAIAVLIMMPLKTVDYRLLTVNPTTGITEIVQPLADAKRSTYGEALDKYWLNRYIQTRGTYQWQTVRDAFDYIRLTSRPDVFSAYNTALRSKNSPVEVFQDKKKIRMKNIAISFLPTNQDQVLAQVAFTKEVLNNNDTPDPTYAPTRWSATVTFDYLKDINTDSDRLLNPLGFRVTSYREDKVIE
ncbi:conjugal transfer protein TraG [Vibrio mediterranei]|jgi:type IV secretion system protein VirB8|uniref:virB8 family protein n=1 Tax=Vibrio mediterranei TaxID=689 RepID=UPI001EFD83F7|nr:VirB8/TrbF family protein [Vibrio mediterranei]MCG9625405.1 conjugal transfer protein TraG [Vibrio mediterranei]